MIIRLTLAALVAVSLNVACSGDGEEPVESPVETDPQNITESIKSPAEETDASSSIVAQDSKTLYVKVPHLYVRTGPGMKYKPISTIPFNKAIQVQETVGNGSWVKIGEGQFVGTKFLSESKNSKVWIPAKYAH